jgi:membrane fusion protein (multidrug efflux system)
MKKIKILVIVLVSLGVLTFIKIKFFQGVADASKYGNKKAGGSPPPAGAVTVFVAKKQNFKEEIISTGTALANEDASLMSEVAGKVVKIYFTEGSFVPKDKLLVKINDTDLQAQLQKLELQIKLAEEQRDRQKQMLDINGVSQQDYDIALNTVNTLKADRAYLITQIRKTEIRAPFSGVIGLKNISEGSYISPSTVVASIQQLTPMKLDFSVPEKYAPLLHIGDAVSFQTEGIPVVFQAKIFAIEPKIDLATRTVKIRALCYDHKNKLFPGAFVKVSMVKESSNSILIPSEALVPELNGYKVFFYRNGKAISGKVTMGTRTDTQVLISNGMEEGDTVITSGLMQLKNEAPVKIVEPAKLNNHE